ncbi:MAG: signal peptidase I [Elusimicrobia bacterium]|nr:signal peptidase I [Elusimicrobiota bacterium]
MPLSRLLFLVVIALAVVLPVRQWVVEPIYIASPSMEPRYPVGGHVFMDKLTLRRRAPRRGEVIVFRSPVGGEHELVKRVIAVPGDTVELKEKRLILNGKEVYESYVKHTRANERLKGDDLGPLTVPEGSLFVLGDNRDESLDSSAWADPSTGEPVRFLPLANVRGLVRGFY